MCKILVIHPFSLRLDSDAPVREFAEGEHTLSEAEYEHWFVQGCIAEGRAKLFSNVDKGGAGGTAQVTREDLMALSAARLRELCEAAGITVPSGSPTKAVLVDLLLAGAEGVTLVSGQDGIQIQKAEAE